MKKLKYSSRSYLITNMIRLTGKLLQRNRDVYYRFSEFMLRNREVFTNKTFVLNNLYIADNPRYAKKNYWPEYRSLPKVKFARVETYSRFSSHLDIHETKESIGYSGLSVEDPRFIFLLFRLYNPGFKTDFFPFDLNYNVYQMQYLLDIFGYDYESRYARSVQIGDSDLELIAASMNATVMDAFLAYRQLPEYIPSILDSSFTRYFRKSTKLTSYHNRWYRIGAMTLACPHLYNVWGK